MIFLEAARHLQCLILKGAESVFRHVLGIQGRYRVVEISF